MRLALFLTLFCSLSAFAQDCDWSSEADGDVPAVDTSGSFNQISCPGNLTISGNFDFNNLAGIDLSKPALIEVNGNMTINSGVTVSLNGGQGGAGNSITGNIIGGASSLSGANGGGNFGTAEDGEGYPKPPATPIGQGSGKPGQDGIGATPGSGGGGANFLDATGTNGVSSGVAGGAEGSLVSNSNFNFSALFFGGNGGGAGGIGNNGNDYGGGGGGGAGALKLSIAGNLILLSNAKITANGGNGGTGFGQGAGGGGGSGGAIHIVSSGNITIDSAAGTIIQAIGGLAGVAGGTGVAGGSGGNGVIRIEYAGSIIGGGQVSPTPTLVDTSATSVNQQLQKFSSDISCGAIPRQDHSSSSWQILLGFMLAACLIKRKKPTNF